MHKGMVLLGVFLISVVAVFADPISPGFSYQGRLMNGATAVNGTHDFTFALYGEAAGGAPITSLVTLSQVPVVEGLFTVVLPFEPALFNGQNRWMEIGVRPAGEGQFVPLQPRQLITATPYASYATQSATAGLAQTVAPGSISLSNLEPGLVTSLASNVSSFDSITVTNGIWVGGNKAVRMAVLQNNGAVSVLSDPSVSQFPKIEFGTNINGGWAGVGNRPAVGWQANHGENGGEIHLTSPGNISINANYDGGNPNSGIQLGSSGQFHDRLYVQYDYYADATVPNGYSKVFEFRSTYLDTNNVVRANTARDGNWAYGFRQEALDRQGDCKLVLYSMTPIVTGKRNPALPYQIGNNSIWSTGSPLVHFHTNRLYVNGAIFSTNTSAGKVTGFLGIGGSAGAGYAGAGPSATCLLDVASGFTSGAAVFGADVNNSTRTDGAPKEALLGFAPSATSRPPATFAHLRSEPGRDTLALGGGAASMDSVQEIQFRTAPSQGTASGTTRLRIDEAGKVEAAGELRAAGGLAVGGSSAPRMTSVLSASATLDFAATPAHSAADLTVPVPGAEKGDVVSLGTPSESVAPDSSYSGWVSAPGLVTVRLNNYGMAPTDPAGGVFRVMVTRF